MDEQNEEDIREYPEWMVPHSDFGDAECCGLLLPIQNGENTDKHRRWPCAVFGTAPVSSHIVQNSSAEWSAGIRELSKPPGVIASAIDSLIAIRRIFGLP